MTIDETMKRARELAEETLKYCKDLEEQWLRTLPEEEKREKSNMEIWAENEIRIACKAERGNASEIEWDYGVACYESALKAFRSLAEDGHSGMSIGFTLNILNRLVKGQPLTPIEDTDDVWEERGQYLPEANHTTYQCKRMSSLFKNVYDDGHIEYNDVHRFYCVKLDDPICWYNGHVAKIASEYFPITMPYFPHTYTVVCEEFLTDRRNGDFDTLGILYIYDDTGMRKEVNRYFAEIEEGWREIELSEYEQRRQKDDDRKAAEAAFEEGEIRMENVKKHMEICKELNDLYERKNRDYGDSFHISFAEEGMAMARIRLGDKLNRFKTLTKGGGQQVQEESIRDTLIDLANYAIMTVMEIDGRK